MLSYDTLDSRVAPHVLWHSKCSVQRFHNLWARTAYSPTLFWRTADQRRLLCLIPISKIAAQQYENGRLLAEITLLNQISVQMLCVVSRAEFATDNSAYSNLQPPHTWRLTMLSVWDTEDSNLAVLLHLTPCAASESYKESFAASTHLEYTRLERKAPAHALQPLHDHE